MTTVFVQFADATGKTVVSVFGCQQDAEKYPNQAQVPSNDARYSAYYNALPSYSQTGLIAPGS
ncbi:hypothetical protein ACI2VP_05330 [Ralstonia nicotianae]|uniref:hypothetical protein n=1 Tax=Ralstonia pseudosolanacearum TaxID=1310165 RepID=UPI0011467D1C